MTLLSWYIATGVLSTPVTCVVYSVASPHKEKKEDDHARYRKVKVRKQRARYHRRGYTYKKLTLGSSLLVRPELEAHKYVQWEDVSSVYVKERLPEVVSSEGSVLSPSELILLGTLGKEVGYTAELVSYAEVFKSQLSKENKSTHPCVQMALFQLLDFYRRPIEDSPIRQKIDTHWSSYFYSHFSKQELKRYDFDMKVYANRLGFIFASPADSMRKAIMMASWEERKKANAFTPFGWHNPYTQSYTYPYTGRMTSSYEKSLVPTGDAMETVLRYLSHFRLPKVKDPEPIPCLPLGRSSVQAWLPQLPVPLGEVPFNSSLGELSEVELDGSLASTPFTHFTPTPSEDKAYSGQPEFNEYGAVPLESKVDKSFYSPALIISRVTSLLPKNPTLEEYVGTVSIVTLKELLSSMTLITTSTQPSWFFVRTLKQLDSSPSDVALYSTLYLHLMAPFTLPLPTNSLQALQSGYGEDYDSTRSSIIEDSSTFILNAREHQGYLSSSRRSDASVGAIKRNRDVDSKLHMLVDQWDPADYSLRSSSEANWVASNPISWSNLDIHWVSSYPLHED